MSNEQVAAISIDPQTNGATSEEYKRSKFFDFIDNVDRYLYGRKMKNFITGAVLVLIIAPFLDWILEVPYDRLTWLSTFVYLIYVVLIVLAWVSAWRDDDGKWTWARAKSRLLTYYGTLKDTVSETRTNAGAENLYTAAKILFWGSICSKALQNVSVFARKPLQNLFSTRFSDWRHYEVLISRWYWVFLLISIGIFVYLYRTNPKILERIKREFLQFFSSTNTQGGKYSNEVVTIQTQDAKDLVVASRRDEQMQSISKLNNTQLFGDFVSTLKKWNPGNCKYEYEFQDKLYAHLKKNMPEATVELEYPLVDPYNGNKKRADIVINDTILIEMKREGRSGEVNRAQGQIGDYSRIWNSKGPVILLLCNFDYEKARLNFTPRMIELHQLQRSVLTVVAEN